MSNKKQSSVEWFNSELEQLLEKHGYISKKMLRIHFNRAKEMHKDDLKETWDNAAIDATYGNKFQNFEQYYNETFGGDNE